MKAFPCANLFGPEMDAAMNLDLTRGDRNICFAQKKRRSPTENDAYICVCVCACLFMLDSTGNDLFA